MSPSSRRDLTHTLLVRGGHFLAADGCWFPSLQDLMKFGSVFHTSQCPPIAFAQPCPVATVGPVNTRALLAVTSFLETPKKSGACLTCDSNIRLPGHSKKHDFFAVCDQWLSTPH